MLFHFEVPIPNTKTELLIYKNGWNTPGLNLYRLIFYHLRDCSDHEIIYITVGSSFVDFRTLH